MEAKQQIFTPSSICSPVYSCSPTQSVILCSVILIFSIIEASPTQDHRTEVGRWCRYFNDNMTDEHSIKSSISIQMMIMMSLIMKTIPLLMLILINLFTFKLLRRKFKRCVQTARRRRRYNRAVISILTIVLSFVTAHGLDTVINIMEIMKLTAGNVFFRI